MSTSRIDTETLGILCTCAVRYALGRRSYITKEVANIVVRYKRHLSGYDTNIILSDLFDAERNGGLGDESDAASWAYLRRELEHMEKK